MTENSLIKLGELSKPATVLVQKVSNAVGGVFRPFQIVGVAKAEAEAAIIRARAEVEVTELQRRAMSRFVEEESGRQQNMESITAGAIPLLADESAPESVENDWLTNFFDKCRIVSDADMQRLWSSVLAGEANTPGAFSRRTVNLLADLDKRDAELFTRLCGFAWMLGDPTPLVFDVLAETYTSAGVTFTSLSHLDSLGLVQFDHIAGFRRLKLSKRGVVSYYGRPLLLEFPQDSDNSLDLGKVLFTRAGQELAGVCGSVAVDGYFELACDYWRARGVLATPLGDDGKAAK